MKLKLESCISNFQEELSIFWTILFEFDSLSQSLHIYTCAKMPNLHTYEILTVRLPCSTEISTGPATILVSPPTRRLAQRRPGRRGTRAPPT